MVPVRVLAPLFPIGGWPSKVFGRGRLLFWWRTACWSSLPCIMIGCLEYRCHHVLMFFSSVRQSHGEDYKAGTIGYRLCLLSKQRKALIPWMRLTCRVASLESSATKAWQWGSIIPLNPEINQTTATTLEVSQSDFHCISFFLTHLESPQAHLHVVRMLQLMFLK